MDFVLITGASGGIGREFAFYYAARKKNLVLIARRWELLNQAKVEIESRYGVEVKIFGMDITQAGAFDPVVEWIKANDIRIGILINNAGVCYAGELALLEEEKVSNILDLNIKALVMCCRKIIPLMKEKASGKVLNIASVAAFEPCPYYALYFASKSFVLSFTEALHAECKPYNIGVSALCPGFVQTDMIADLPDLGIKPASPEEIVRLGDRLLNANRTVGVNGFVNNFLVFLVKTLPRSVVRWVTNKLVKMRLEKTHVGN